MKFKVESENVMS